MGSIGDVLKELKNIEGVKEAYSLYGVYDIVTKVEAETMDKLKDIVTRQIRRLNNVRTTLTMLVIKET
jgi:DNA-binding Lrp family transcriptional regulator